MIVALAGGVGGARLAVGLAAVLPPPRLTVVVNTGDDFEHLGLSISPDLDTRHVHARRREQPRCRVGTRGRDVELHARRSRELGGETWFRLGDRDLAVHVLRTLRARARRAALRSHAARWLPASASGMPSCR